MIPEDAWKHTGVRVVPGDQLDTNTPQRSARNTRNSEGRTSVIKQRI